MKRAILYVTFAALCGAQTTVNGGRDYKGTLKASGSVSAVDFSGAGGTAPAKAGTSISTTTAIRSLVRHHLHTFPKVCCGTWISRR